MIDAGREFVTQIVTIPPQPGTLPVLPTPPPLTMRLRSQQLPIRGVSVDAEHYPGAVTVYGGTSANGIGYVVAGGSARAFAVEGTSSIYVVFDQPLAASGFVRLTAYSFPVISYGMATGASVLEARLAKLDETAKDILAWLKAHP